MCARIRLLLLWLVAAVALSFDKASCHAFTESDEIKQRSNSTIQRDELASRVCADFDENNNTTTPTNVDDTCSSATRWSGDNLVEVLASWEFAPEEEASLFDLRDRLADIDHWKNDPAEVARFLKEHNFDAAKAERMFRSMIAWRSEFKVDEFMEHYGEPPEVFHYAPLFLLKGLDYDGDPILVLRIGALDAWGLYQRLGEQAMLEANRFVSEIHTSRDVGIPQGWKWQKEYYEPLTGRRATQFTILVDLEGLGPRLLRPAMFSVLQKAARVAQDHYPGLAKRMIFLRAPRLFQMAWRVAKHFYDSRVHHKFIFSNRDDYLEVLSRYMDLDILPSVINPSGRGTQMPGFFEKIRMEGGLIPTSNNDGDTNPALGTNHDVAPNMATADMATAS